MSWLSACGRWVSAAAGAVLVLAGANAALAGQLILRNTSNEPIACTVDGWTIRSGGSFDWSIQVPVKGLVSIGANASRQGDPVINWAKCGNLPATRQMNITAKGPNQTLVLNAQQTRVLNVALYPYLPTLPTLPTDRFEPLVAYVVDTFQTQNPKVLLNAVMNPAVNIYDFDNLERLLSGDGFDVIELDTLYLGFLAGGDMINPVKITGETPVQVALDAATYSDQLYGIPSWLCMDFVYSADQAIQNQDTLSALRQYLTLAADPNEKTGLAAVYNGSWRLPSIYVNSFVQTRGYGAIAQATQMPPDNVTIGQLALLVDTCFSAQTNTCTDGSNKTRQEASAGYVEQFLASDQAVSMMGFSEQSFFVKLRGMAGQLYVTPAPWGRTPQPLLFSDAFVSSKLLCAVDTACFEDAQTFTNLMTGVSMKNYIVKSQDLPPQTPWRTLLVSTDAFWKQQDIQQHPLYKQYSKIFATARPFPNIFTADLQKTMGLKICAAIKEKRQGFACKS